MCTLNIEDVTGGTLVVYATSLTRLQSFDLEDVVLFAYRATTAIIRTSATDLRKK